MTSVDGRRVLFVHAHPDDESITTGGTIARYSAEGAHVTVVTCTLGEEGEIIPAELEQLGAWAGDQLGGYRIGELAEAGVALGWSEHRFLGGPGRWRDSGMAGVESNEHPRAFVRGAMSEQVEQLLAVFDEVRPEVVVTYDPNGGYGHPDHIRAHRVATAAVERSEGVRRLFYTVSSREATTRGLAALRRDERVPFRVPADEELPTTPDADITTRVDISAYREVKFAALRAHRTQITVGPDCFALSNGIAQPVPTTEFFVLARGPKEGADTDLFGGL
ncbi:N-acetyl-1-D-myo-inositol-2-amino-2-deoxy-alpha-D-glucopyranoside deacetylase [Saccharomonospora viridis]|uniref:1D-myo-inositol 2-acetamido-2-deoxy-alpha-D-glucopyranoside deacetylase n=1 Tax=Saccharomonospora viridis TaxID=1852 RepID=A0A837DFS2_9PSEU|nr:1D-myo-inositol 2-acetamido-2-deoxy-alpha-D-glucopyranoside deacetylase [Saccharomonospora viridis]SFP35847.1 N-acetyl-1-D-myo-inositol-2-amino-2-deoxy-alpha-D-glucopyranoside deacetylase [Saccharomonospora viridis]